MAAILRYARPDFVPPLTTRFQPVGRLTPYSPSHTEIVPAADAAIITPARYAAAASLITLMLPARLLALAAHEPQHRDAHVMAPCAAENIAAIPRRLPRPAHAAPRCPPRDALRLMPPAVAGCSAPTPSHDRHADF